jgi:hypothetical protein
MHKFLVCLALLLVSSGGNSQPFRAIEYNSIGWYSLFVNKKINDKWSAHVDYQWRRTNWIATWQQSLLRVGINYHIRPNLITRIGYAWIETYPYGETPINIFGKQFTEHRSFIMLESRSSFGNFHFTQRNKVEQRWIEQYLTPNLTEPNDWSYVNRYRQLFRAEYRFLKNQESDRYLFLTLMNETFIGFGKNINQNVFDQNRFAAMPGIDINKSTRIEIGYYYQVLQLPRRINQLNVFQHNSGIMANMYVRM